MFSLFAWIIIAGLLGPWWFGLAIGAGLWWLWGSC